MTKISKEQLDRLNGDRERSGRFGSRPKTIGSVATLQAPPSAESHRMAARDAILSSTPEERAYYAANDAKHFGSTNGPGSQFTEVLDTEALVAMASEQRGSLTGDDRDELIARGGDPAGFMPGKRYLMVETAGVLGIKSGDEVDDDTPVTITRTKPGTPCSMVASVREKTPVDYGVVIMGTHNVTAQPFVISTFPGKVTRPTNDERIDQLEGRTVPAGQLRKLLGRDEFDAMTLNTRVVD